MRRWTWIHSVKVRADIRWIKSVIIVIVVGDEYGRVKSRSNLIDPGSQKILERAGLPNELCFLLAAYRPAAPRRQVRYP